MGPLTADEQEAQARALNPCGLADVDATEWPVHLFPPSIQLRLPPDYHQNHASVEDQRSWVGVDGSRFLLTRHSGDGRALTMITFDRAGAPSEAYACSIRLGNRLAVLNTYTFPVGEQLFYYAAGDAGIRLGLGVGVAVLALTDARRAELIAAIATIEIAE